jgi:RsmE family RNA methyltransferase
MQSRRCWLPEIAGPVRLTSIVPAPGILLCHPGGEATLGPDSRTLLVGPEGGWDPAEIEPFAKVGSVAGLGTGTLRAETAVVAAGVLLGALRSGTVRPAEATRRPEAPGPPSRGDRL